MLTYLTATGEVLDLSDLSGDERAYFDESLKAYQEDESFETFAQRTYSSDNPALRPNGRVTNETFGHPLFRAVLDMECRLGVRAGVLLLASGSDVETDPMGDAMLSIAKAAELSRVTRETIYNAIGRGELVATKVRPVRVSANSVRRWKPLAARQAAGRASAAERSLHRAS